MPNVVPELPEEYRLTILMKVQTIILVAMTIALVMAIWMYSPRVQLALLVAAAIIGFSRWLAVRRFLYWAAGVLVSTILVVSTLLAYLGQGIYDVALTNLLGILVLAGLVFNSRGFLLFIAFEVVFLNIVGWLTVINWQEGQLNYIRLTTKSIYGDTFTYSIILIGTAAMVHLAVRGIRIHMHDSVLKQQQLERLSAHLQLQIGERQHAEQAVRQLNAQLEQRVQERTLALQQANQELESFSYSVSHDLRAPLRSIHGFTTALNDDYGAQLNDDAQGLLRRVLAGATRMDTLISDLLRFAHVSRIALRYEHVSLHNTIEQVWSELNEMHTGDLPPLTVPVIPICRGDGNLLKQVIFNLLSNAVKFTQKVNTRQIDILAIENAEEIVIGVRDNGAGFDMAYADKLFGVFQRLHRAEQFEGTGVGLALSRRIIERHGGRIWAESKVNKGATFWFSLPLKSKPDQG